MNVLGNYDVSKSLGVNPDVKVTGGWRSDLEVAVGSRSGLAQSLTFSIGTATDELNRSLGQPVSLRVGDSAPQRDLLAKKRKRETSQQQDKNCQIFSV
jgi:hypothetical protein